MNGHKLQLGHANHAWLCLDLLDVLCHLAERGHALSVRSILEYPLQHCPEVLLLGMAHINVHSEIYLGINLNLCYPSTVNKFIFMSTDSIQPAAI